MDTIKLGMAWAGASKEDVEKANKQVWRDSGKRLAQLQRRRDLIKRIRENDNGETMREMVGRYRRYD